MGYAWGLILILCINGCSELRIIGDAAMREIRAEAITVNWISEKSNEVEKRNETFINQQLPSGNGRNFSSFRPDHPELKKSTKGLWEQHSGNGGVR